VCEHMSRSLVPVGNPCSMEERRLTSDRTSDQKPDIDREFVIPEQLMAAQLIAAFARGKRPKSRANQRLRLTLAIMRSTFHFLVKTTKQCASLQEA
jgi:hypothetical protein